MNLMSYANREFDILESEIPDAVVLEFKSEILAIVEKFGNAGLSGGSAPFYLYAIINTLEKLMKFNSLTPIEESDNSHWSDDEILHGVEQSSRCSALFKENNECRYNDAITFVVFDGVSENAVTIPKNETTNGRTISSSLPVRCWPFVPKKFIVRLFEESNGNYTIIDEQELREAYDYYGVEW